MKRHMVAVLTALLAAPFALGQTPRQGGRGSGRGGGGGNGGGPVIIKKQRFSVPAPARIEPHGIVNDQRRIAWPRADGTGARILQSPAAVPPRHHAEVVRNGPLVKSITVQQRAEIVPNRYYWHDYHGMRYAHFYDPYGVHWYGFYHGPHFYWTRYYGNYWWWYDVNFARWVFWWDGFWWWPGPAGYYVYVDNSYYPYQEGGVVVQHSEEQPPAAGVPAPGAGSSWTSPDGKRMVQVAGSDAEAFLYDKSGSQPAFLKFLGRGVDKARFSGGASGKPTRVLLEFKDGTFALFDQDGNPIDEPEAAGEAPGAPPGAPPAPKEIPPAPGAPPSN